MKTTLGAIVVLLLCDVCHAALFLGPSSFSFGPTSQLGIVTNNLTLTDNANGFVVAGQLIVSVPATMTPIAGTLATWTVDRPLDPTYGSGTLFTTTVLNGFSQPPVGSVGSTNGFVESIFTNYLGTSLSLIPTSLVAGVDAPPWNNLSVNSANFSYTSGGTNYLRQVFQLDGIYLNGPGGNWIINVPVVTMATAVPEPSMFELFAISLVSLVGYGLRRRLA